MDRVEQFIRDGVQNPRSPWVGVRRKLLIGVIGWGLLLGVGFWVNSAKYQYYPTPEAKTQAFWMAVGLWAGVYLLLVLFGLFKSLTNAEFHRTLGAWKRWGAGEPDLVKISQTDFAAASKALREFKPIKPSEALEKYGQDTIDLLVLSGGIWEHDGKLRKLVSIRSIDEDREAGPEDDNEE